MSDPKLRQRLLEDVVIFENKEVHKTGAELIAPDHSPRQAIRGKPLPAGSALTETATLQQRVEQFLFHQAELLDEKQWGAYIDLFAMRVSTGCPQRRSRPNGWTLPPYSPKTSG